MTSPSSYKFFIEPFATGGDTTTIPVPPQSGGLVSMTEGFTSVYEIADHADPMYQPVPRAQSNWLYYVITQAIKQYQTFGTPEWIDTASNGGTPFPYDKYAKVLYTDGKVYLSLVTSNTTTPGTDPTKWQLQNTGAKSSPTPQTYTAPGTTYTFAHGLGVAPEVVSIKAVNLVADSGYSPGNTILFSDAPVWTESYNSGVTVEVDATNIYVRIGAYGVNIVQKGTYANGFMDYLGSSWSLQPFCAVL